MQVFLFIAYAVVGLVQLFAIMAGLSYALNIEGFLAFLISLFITYIPLLGSIAGVYGAVHVWDWGWPQALTLFFWYVPVVLIMAAVGGVGELFSRSR